MLKGDNFLRENHQGGPNLTLLNVLNVLSLLKVLNMPKDASLASGPCLLPTPIGGLFCLNYVIHHCMETTKKKNKVVYMA